MPLIRETRFLLDRSFLRFYFHCLFRPFHEKIFLRLFSSFLGLQTMGTMIQRRPEYYIIENR